MDVQIPMRGGPAAAQTNLNAQKRRHLYELVQHPGYPVLLEMMELRCVIQDAKLLAVPNGERDHVIAEHAISFAMWEFFGGLQAQVKFECAEAWGEMSGGTRQADESPAIGEDNIL